MISPTCEGSVRLLGFMSVLHPCSPFLTLVTFLTSLFSVNVKNSYHKLVFHFNKHIYFLIFYFFQKRVTEHSYISMPHVSQLREYL